MPELFSERLRLRGHCANDHAAATDLWQQPEVYRFILPEAPSSQDVWLRLLRYSGLWDFFGFGYWAVEERESEAYIGQIGFADFRRGLVGFDTSVPEAGWVIHPRYSGRGLATEAMRVACDWLDRQSFAERSFCLIDPGNLPSRRIADKLGYRLALTTPMGEKTAGVYLRSRVAS